jgi:hypothetical protein
MKSQRLTPPFACGGYCLSSPLFSLFITIGEGDEEEKKEEERNQRHGYVSPLSHNEYKRTTCKW